MRILYLHQYFNLPTDSGGTRSYEMARRLVAANHEVFMITSDRSGKFQKGWNVTREAGIVVHWLPVAYSNKMSYQQRVQAFLKFAWGAARKAASIPADVIFSTSTPLTIAIPGVYAARRQHIPMVFEVRDLWPDVPVALGVVSNPLLVSAARQLEKFAYANSTRIVALAPGMAQQITKKGYPSERIAVIPNGADIEVFQEYSGTNLAEEYPWIKGAQLIVYVGTVGVVNGVDYIPRLAAEIMRIDPSSSIRFAIIGDGRCMPEVRAAAEKLGVLDNLVFFIGEIPKNEVPKWLSKCSATIMTYEGPEVLYRDSVSNKFFDSLAAGKPVFANFCGFSTVIAKSVEAGKILSNGDFPGAADLIIRCLNDSEWLLRASKASFNLARALFDRNKLADYLETVLMDAVAGPGNNLIGSVGKEFEEIWIRAFKNQCIVSQPLSATNQVKKF